MAHKLVTESRNSHANGLCERGQWWLDFIHNPAAAISFEDGKCERQSSNKCRLILDLKLVFYFLILKMSHQPYI